MAKGAKIISTAQARSICSNWHGGQSSAIYQFASSGVFVKDNYRRYLNEIDNDQRLLKNPKGTPFKELQALKKFFEYKGKEAGIKKSGGFLDWLNS